MSQYVVTGRVVASPGRTTMERDKFFLQKKSTEWSIQMMAPIQWTGLKKLKLMNLMSLLKRLT